MFAYSWADNYDETSEPSALDWEAAACRDGTGSLTALFFSDEIPDIELAKAICRCCSLRVPCLEGALARREPVGVWGGQLFADGQVIARKRKRGRPPKVAATMPSEPMYYFGGRGPNPLERKPAGPKPVEPKLVEPKSVEPRSVEKARSQQCLEFPDQHQDAARGANTGERLKTA